MVYPYKQLKEETVEEIKARQLTNIKDYIEFAYHNTSYYKDLFDKNNIKIGDISSFDDLRRIPITTKEDLRKNNPRFYGTPEEEWIDMSCTSGTTGTSVYIPFTHNDMKRIAIRGAQTLRLSGINETDRIHLAMPMCAWMWMAGFGFYMCFSTAGVCVLRFGPGYSEKSLATIKNFSATAIMGVPSYLVKLGEMRERMQIETSVKRVFTIGENIMNKDLTKNALGKKLEELWKAEVFSCYGATEGTFLAVECNRFAGHHINPDELYMEILDPDTLEPVKDGEEGLVTITPLWAEGLTLLRYVNGDMSFIIPGRCPCGRMLQRVGPAFARVDQMMKVKGVMIYPEAIKNIIAGTGKIDLFQVEAYTENFSDLVRIYVPSDADEETDRKSALDLRERIRMRIGVTLEVKPISRKKLQGMIFPPGKRKPVMFVDKRSKQ